MQNFYDDSKFIDLGFKKNVPKKVTDQKQRKYVQNPKTSKFA